MRSPSSPRAIIAIALILVSDSSGCGGISQGGVVGRPLDVQPLQSPSASPNNAGQSTTPSVTPKRFEDRSLSATQYIEIGFPSLERKWAAADYTAVAGILKRVADSEPGQLPRFQSPTSGDVFERLVAADNLNYLRDATLSLDDRWVRALEILAGTKEILVLYMDANQEGPGAFSSETVEVLGFLLRQAVVLSELVNTTTQPGAPGDSGKHHLLPGAADIQIGLFSIVDSSLSAFEQPSHYTLNDALRIAGHLQETLPTLLWILTWADANSVAARLDAIVNGDDDPKLQQAATELSQTFSTISIADVTPGSDGSNAATSAGSDGSGKPSGDPVKQPTADVVPRVPTDDECRAFVEALRNSIRIGDINRFNEHFDWATILHRATQGLGLSPSDEWMLTKEFMTSTVRSNFARNIIDVGTHGGSYKLVRIHDVDGQKRALMRLILPDGGNLNYHDYLLASKPDGRIQFVDMFALNTDELMSETFRRAILPVVNQRFNGITLPSSEKSFVDNGDKVRRMTELLQSDPASCLQVFGELPESVRREKSVLITRMTAAQALNDEEHLAAIEDFRKQYPESVCLDFMFVDFHFTKADFAKALEHIDRVDRVLQDPYLSVSRATIHYAAKNLSAAVDACRTAYQHDSTLPDAFWILVTVSLDNRDFGLTASLLTHLEDKCGAQLGNLQEIPEYADFVKSPNYAEWMKARTQPASKKRSH